MLEYAIPDSKVGGGRRTARRRAARVATSPRESRPSRVGSADDDGAAGDETS